MPVKAVQQFMLGTVLGSEKQARHTLRLMREAGYEGIELCGFMIHPASPVVRMMTRAAGMPVGRGGRLDWNALVRESGLSVVALHTDLGSLERDAAAVAAEAKSFGTSRVVVTGMYRFDYTDAGKVQSLAQRLNVAGAALEREGCSLFYHNHNVELQRTGDGRRAYEILLTETQESLVSFEFDSYWFAEGGADPLIWMKRLGSRMKLWHINDRGARISGTAMTPIVRTDSMELGCGNMDLESLTAQALSCGAEAVILESHRNWEGGSPIRSFQRSAEFLNRMLA
ncbi:MAG: TIM barrel protein [Eubacteriales bacterium]|nr:TIM barrel protein [Eubacteriales bacterium]